MQLSEIINEIRFALGATDDSYIVIDKKTAREIVKTLARIEKQNETRRRNGRRGGRPPLPEDQVSAAALKQREYRERKRG